MHQPSDASQIRIDCANSIPNYYWTRALHPRDSAAMIAQPYKLYIERRDAKRGMARFYALSISPTLFGDIQLTRRWGRIGGRGQAISHSFAREDEAVRLFLDLLRRKRRRGYAPRGAGALPIAER